MKSILKQIYGTCRFWGVLPAIGLFLCISLAGVSGFCQENPPFFKEVMAFKQQDSLRFPAKGQVLFTGSSSFTNWKDVQAYFPGVPILNRAFGGSSLTHLIQYQNDIIYPYQPARIVIYCGENDFAGDATLPADSVVLRFKNLFADIRTKLPRVQIVYVSMKPSPARKKLLTKFEVANFEISEFLRKQKKATYVNVYDAMLLPDKSPNGALFLKDSLHMNAAGYQLWQGILKKSVKSK
jgi:lysophospholipase L1-like esterase